MMNLFRIAVIIFLWSGCSPNNVKEDKGLLRFFNENNVIGCFALMDNSTGNFTVHNLRRYRDSAYLPASTFKIVNSLVGLQTGIISSDSMVIKWDGISRGMDAWNKDMNMYDAFRVSSLPYYQEVARRIGKDTMQYWLDLLGYGSKKITTSVDSFWIDNSMKVTPDENLGLVKRLYFGQLPFHKYNQEIVKRAMLFEDNSNYKLSYKTGWGFDEKGNHIGWVVGWVEENRRPYFFVLNIESPEKDFDMLNIRLKMLKDILKYLGFLEGKM